MTNSAKAEENAMKRRWLWYGLRFAVFAVIAVVLVGAAVMLLWNALLPGLFGVPAITFLQAIGLLVLTRILVGGLRGRWGHHGHWRARMAERWERMSDEERAQFRGAMRRRCGHRGDDPVEQQV
jgi:hypothetical protein